MSGLRIISRPVVGNATETHWGQALLSQNAYGVIEIQGEEAMKRGIEILSLLDRRLDGIPMDPKAVSVVVDEVLDESVVSLVVVVFRGTTGTMVCYGKGALFLRRNMRFASILNGSGFISGNIEVGDVLILLSDSAQTVFPESRIVSLVDGSDVQVIAERMNISWHQEGGGLGGSALLLGAETGGDSGIGEPFVSLDLKNEETTGSSVTSMTQKKSISQAVIPFLKSLVRELRLRFIALPKPTRKRIILALCLSLLFLLSVGIGIKRQMTDRRSKETITFITDARRIFEEGVALTEIHPAKARDELLKAKESAKNAVSSARPRTKEYIESTELVKQIDEALLLASRVYIEEPSLFYDASLLRSDARISVFSLEGDVILLLDSQGKSLMSLSLSSKNAQILSGGQALSGSTFIARHGDTGYIFTGEAIQGIDLKTKILTPGVIRKTEDWGTIVSLVSYGGNIYVLDKNKGRIWKYVAVAFDKSGKTGFSEIREYLNPDTLPDFSGALNMTIDGSVWVGTNNGKIYRFTQGQENTFTPEGVDPKFSGPVRVYTNDDLKRVYVLDSSGKRVVVLEKDGVYTSQYEWKSAFSPSDIAVSEEQRKILLLSDGKIFSIDLK